MNTTKNQLYELFKLKKKNQSGDGVWEIIKDGFFGKLPRNFMTVAFKIENLTMCLITLEATFLYLLLE